MEHLILYLSAAVIVLLAASFITLLVVYRRSKQSASLPHEQDLSATGESEQLRKSELLRDSELLREEVARLSAAYSEAAETIRQKDEFYTGIVHDLKTPISIISSTVQLINQKAAGRERSEVVSRYMPSILRSCQVMLRLVENMQSMARMKAGALPLRAVSCAIDALLDEIVRSVQPYAMQKGLQLHYSKPDSPITTAVDVEKFERILLNLLSNAIRYTPPGGTVTVASSFAGDTVRIMVKDTGIGIPKAYQEQVFDRFQQTGRVSALERSGSGIGLSLVKAFVELHKGSIHLISQENAGTEFIIDLPYTKSEHSSWDASAQAASAQDTVFDLSSPDARQQLSEAAKVEFSGVQSLSS